jgi:tRNA(Ile)-lysidine synthetase-like protein
MSHESNAGCSEILQRHVKKFCATHLPQGSRILLGCSGGIDSTALLHLIHDLITSHSDDPLAPSSCHVVHVDHGWRQESGIEAQILEARVAALGFPFTSFLLPRCPEGENLEDWSRRERMRCFRQCAQECGARAVLLAHHADDQLEVVLKRFLEGASLTKFRGMRAVERHGDITVLRPLLTIKKADLLSYLHARGLQFFDDPTNHDTTFLRGRMREVIFPFLRQSFGKEFGNSLLRVAEEAAALEQFVVEECQRHCVLDTSPGVVFASLENNVSAFLASSIIDLVGNEACLPSCSRSQRVAAGRVFCGLQRGPKRWYVGKGALFAEHHEAAAFTRVPPDIVPTRIEAVEGRCMCGEWAVTWQPMTQRPSGAWHWKELFSGVPYSMCIPSGPFTISPSSDRLLQSIRRPALAHPLPAFLRSLVPSFVQGIELVADPGNEYTFPHEMSSGCSLITIQRCP